MFRVLHVASDSLFKADIEEIVLSKGGRYRFILENRLERMKTDGNYDLIVVESNHSGNDCIRTIEYLQKKSSKAETVIVIADEIEFEDQAALYEMGVMVILERASYDNDRFDVYIDTVKRDVETIKILKETKIAVVHEGRHGLHKS